MLGLNKYLAQQFAKPSGKWGKCITLLMNLMNQKQYQSVLELLDLQPTDVVLDVGFWNGFLLWKILDTPLQHLHGIEISEDMFNLVQDKYQQAISRGQLSLTLADVKKLPFPDAYFDKVYTVNTFYFWKDIGQSLAEIKRVLKPQGQFINVIYTKQRLDKLHSITKHQFWKHSLEDIIKYTESNGLHVMDCKQIVPEKSYCIIATK